MNSSDIYSYNYTIFSNTVIGYTNSVNPNLNLTDAIKSDIKYYYNCFIWIKNTADGDIPAGRRKNNNVENHSDRIKWQTDTTEFTTSSTGITTIELYGTAYSSYYSNSTQAEFKDIIVEIISPSNETICNKMNFKYNLTCTKQCNDEVGDPNQTCFEGTCNASADCICKHNNEDIFWKNDENGNLCKICKDNYYPSTEESI